MTSTPQDCLREAIALATGPTHEFAYTRCLYCEATWYGERPGRENPEKPRHRSDCVILKWEAALKQSLPSAVEATAWAIDTEHEAFGLTVRNRWFFEDKGGALKRQREEGGKLTPLYESPPSSTTESKPVAWMCEDNYGRVMFSWGEKKGADPNNRGPWQWRPLYTTPLSATRESCAACEAWNLICPKCGAAKGEKCGWPQNCPTGQNHRTDSATNTK